MRVLVVGAGPTGLTAALEFSKNGIKVDIVERRDSPSPLSRAVGIMPESLKKLGGNVKEKIIKEGIPFSKINMHIGLKRIMSLNLGEHINHDDVMIGLPQDRVEEIIREELEKYNVFVGYGTEAKKVSTTDKKAEVVFGDMEDVKEYDWIVACDGVRSTVREELGIPYLGFEIDKTWSIADVDLEENFAPDTISVWMKLGKRNDAIISLPIGKSRVRVISSTSDSLETLPIPVKISRIRREGAFKISVKQAESYQKGRVLLAGDACHSHSPVGGKGMNLGIDDAIYASHAIMNSNTERYTEERKKIARKVIRESEFARKRIMSTSWATKQVMTLLFGTVNKFPFLQNKAIRFISKL